jgi:hypothetical protein
MTSQHQQILRYQTVKAFLTATKSMLHQFPSDYTQSMGQHIQTLEIQLETAYQQCDAQSLLSVSEKADTLAIDLLDYLDAINLNTLTALQA